MAIRNKAEKPIREQLAELQRIVKWFEEREDVDLEEGIKKVKEGAAIAKALKKRLAETENEFEEIKKDLESES